MAFNIGEILLSALVGPMQAIVQEQVFQSLEKFKANDPVEYQKAIVSIYTVFAIYLIPLAQKSKTKIDDAALTAILEAVKQSAEGAGIELPKV